LLLKSAKEHLMMGATNERGYLGIESMERTGISRISGNRVHGEDRDIEDIWE
jgi:hypothetical protein